MFETSHRYDNYTALFNSGDVLYKTGDPSSSQLFVVVTGRYVYLSHYVNDCHIRVFNIVGFVL